MLYNSSLSSVHPLCWTIWFPLSWSSALPASSLWVSTVSQVPSDLMSSLAACVCELCLPSFSSCFSPSPCPLLCSLFWGPHNQLAQTHNFHVLPKVLHPSFITVSSSSSAEIWCFALLSQCLPRAGATPVSKLEKPPVLQYSSGWCRAPGAQSAARKGHCKVSSQENSANPLKSSEFTT